MSEHLRDIFIRNLKFYRKREHLSQEKLSYALDMSMNYINQLENKNSFPPPEIIEKIADILHVRPTELFSEGEAPQNLVASNREDFIETLTERIHARLKDEIQRSITDAISESLR